MISFEEYYSNGFITDISRFASEMQIKKCSHHNIPQDLAYFVDEKLHNSFSEYFYISWFLKSVVSQVLHKHSAEDHQRMLQIYGPTPIPMRGSGFGCIMWDNPIWLVEKYVDLRSSLQRNQFSEVIRFWAQDTKDQFLSSEHDLSFQEFCELVVNDY